MTHGITGHLRRGSAIPARLVAGFRTGCWRGDGTEVSYGLATRVRFPALSIHPTM